MPQRNAMRSAGQSIVCNQVRTMRTMSCHGVQHPRAHRSRVRISVQQPGSTDCAQAAPCSEYRVGAKSFQLPACSSPTIYPQPAPWESDPNLSHLFPALDPIAACTGTVSSTGVVHGFFSVVPEDDFSRSIGIVMQHSPSPEQPEGGKSTRMQREICQSVVMLVNTLG